MIHGPASVLPVTLTAVYILLCVFAGLFGAAFGSFMNVCISRMPEDRSVAWPGSACPRCGTPIQPHDNIPILSWFVLGGKCRACSGPISPLYPTIEALFAVLAVLLFRQVVPDVVDFDGVHLIAFGWYGYLLFALVALSFIDLKYYIIPDAFSIYGVPVGVGGALLLHSLGYTEGPTWQQSLVGAAVGGGGLLLLMGAYWLLRRKEGMGFGDVKLLALLGSFFGALPALVFILMMASVLGSIVGVAVAVRQGSGLKIQIPFGPFLAVGAIVWLFFQDTLTRAMMFRFDLLW